MDTNHAESADGHEHEWLFRRQEGTDTHWAVTVGCASCDAERTAPVAAAGIARNSVEALRERNGGQTMSRGL